MSRDNFAGSANCDRLLIYECVIIYLSREQKQSESVKSPGKFRKFVDGIFILGDTTPPPQESSVTRGILRLFNCSNASSFPREEMARREKGEREFTFCSRSLIFHGLPWIYE